MNRENKYRVWIPDHAMMIYPKPFIVGKMVGADDLFIRLDGIVCWCPKAGGIDKISNEYFLLQYTGLKDKNGKEIYEGDIVKIVDWDEGETNVTKPNAWEIGSVDFRNGAFRVHAYIICEVARWCEVIGNIYETPELLK